MSNFAPALFGYSTLTRVTEASLPGHRAFGVLPSYFRGALIRGTDHHAFLDHVDDVVLVHRVEEEDLVCFARGEDLRARGEHAGVGFGDVAGTAHAERQLHVARSPFGEADAGHLEVFFRI